MNKLKKDIESLEREYKKKDHLYKFLGDQEELFEDIGGKYGKT